MQHGETITDGDITYTPDMVMGEARRGIKVNYCTDTRPVPIIAEYAKDCDLFICEGMYGEDEKEENAKEHKHMTMMEAATLGKTANPKRMWLTHYSPSMNKPDEYIDKLKKICPVIETARDGWSVELGFVVE